MVSKQGDSLDVSTLLTGNREEDERNVQHLLRTIAEVNSSRDLDQVLASVVDRTLIHTKAERAFLMLIESGRLRRRVARNYKGQDLAIDVSYSRTVPIEVARSGKPKILKNTAAEDVQDLGTSIISLKLLTVMCVPLRYKDRVIGVIYVDSRATTGSFHSSDLLLLNALADQAAVAIENARLHAASLENQRKEQVLRLAQDIQTGLLPKGPLRLEGFDIFGMSASCEQIGGDYFDYVDGPDGILRIAVGDVTGHGVPAALLMTTARALLRATSPGEPDLATCIARLNEHLERDLDPNKFMSLFLAELCPGERTFRYVGAGHGALIVRRDGEIEEFVKTGPTLGVVAGASYRCEGPVSLGSGDLLLAYTDGITEAPAPVGPEGGAPERFGESRLQDVLRGCSDRGARETAQAIRASVADWRQNMDREDDETMVVLKVD